MTASMTAFGRTEETEEIGHILWEIRSVNHRYLEMSMRLPEDFRMLEATIRKHISNRIKRGKIEYPVECTLVHASENRPITIDSKTLTSRA